jgi:hypothetical protein
MRDMVMVLGAPVRYLRRHADARLLVVAALATLLGYALAGCDGQSVPGDAEAGDAHVLGKTDSGRVYCEIPSPTGDQVNSGTRRTAREEVASELATGSFVAAVVASNAGDASKVCASSVSAKADCGSPATDFRGADGVSHCFELVGEDGGRCLADGQNGKTCRLSRIGDVQTSATRPRATEICSADGVFVGWWCNIN